MAGITRDHSVIAIQRYWRSNQWIIFLNRMEISKIMLKFIQLHCKCAKWHSFSKVIKIFTFDSNQNPVFVVRHIIPGMWNRIQSDNPTWKCQSVWYLSYDVGMLTSIRLLPLQSYLRFFFFSHKPPRCHHHSRRALKILWQKGDDEYHVLRTFWRKFICKRGSNSHFFSALDNGKVRILLRLVSVAVRNYMCE